VADPRLLARLWMAPGPFICLLPWRLATQGSVGLSKRADDIDASHDQRRRGAEEIGRRHPAEADTVRSRRGCSTYRLEGTLLMTGRKGGHERALARQSSKGSC
jgi:hypothetical protein